jgi:hypothetical protein
VVVRGFLPEAVCQVSSRAEAGCLSKASVPARSWAGLQRGFISFTPYLAAPHAECQKMGSGLCPLRVYVNCRENADNAVNEKGLQPGANYKPSIRYRPSGVRTPNQLSRTC